RPFYLLLAAAAVGCGISRLEVSEIAPSAPEADASLDSGAPPLPDASAEGDGGLLGEAAPPPAWQWLNPRPDRNEMFDLAGGAPSDVWLAGAGGAVHHWDGKSLVAAYPGQPQDRFYAVWENAPDDVWVAGLGQAGDTRTLHWNGTSWASGFALDNASQVT